MSSASKRRQSSSDDEGGGANWMDTYGDLVTLLLCFFVLLFSFSSVDAAKWEALVGSLSGSAAIAIPVLSPNDVVEQPIPLEVWNTSDDTDVETVDYQTFRQLHTNVATYIYENNINATVEPDWEALILIIRFADNILFESGSDVLRSGALPVLDQISLVMEMNMPLISMIRIEGHTDNRPIRTPRFRNNWDLSAFRALNTMQYILETGGIDPHIITPVGYGEYHPVASNETSEGQQLNRRVDFVIESIRPGDSLVGD